MQEERTTELPAQSLCAEQRGLTWYEDGDIVLSATQDQIQHQFRVHQLILRLASHVFRDMLAIPQPADGKTSHGCPVVPLDDTPSDLNALLNALYNSPTMLRGDHLTLDDALSILKLSDKYMMEDLRSGIIHLLKEHWPINHSDYLIRRRLMMDIDGRRCRITESLKLVKVAQLCNVPELLPTAFYELAASNPRGWNEAELAEAHLVSPVTLGCILMGRDRSAQRLKNLVMSGIFVPEWSLSGHPETIERMRAGTCHYDKQDMGWPEYCVGVFKVLKTKIESQLFDGVFGLEALQKLTASDFPTGKDCCSPCQAWFLRILQNKKVEMWENIPVDFDQPAVDPKEYSKPTFRSF